MYIQNTHTTQKPIAQTVILNSATVILNLIQDPVYKKFIIDWIPGQARNDKTEARNDKAGVCSGDDFCGYGVSTLDYKTIYRGSRNLEYAVPTIIYFLQTTNISNTIIILFNHSFGGLSPPKAALVQV